MKVKAYIKYTLRLSDLTNLICYAKGEFLELNFLAYIMCNIGPVIAQLVTVWNDAIITCDVTS